MIIRNARVFCDDYKFRIKDVYTSGGRFVDSENEADSNCVEDASGMNLIPGLVDIHTHGAVGVEFSECSVEELEKAAEYYYSCGVTTFLATSETDSEESLSRAFEAVAKYNDADGCAHVGGINMEGPFLSPDKLGAMNEMYLKNPDVELFDRLNAISGGQVRLITVAPEIDGAMEFISEMKKRGVFVSLGHTVTDYDTAVRAFEAGASQLTHLYNAMPPLHHRNPALIGAGADYDGCMAEIISDGFHIHPSAIRIAFSIFGAERMILISDAICAMGMPDGDYVTAGLGFTKTGCKALLPDGTIAGSATNQFECMRRAMSFGIPEESAVRAATANPAKAVGLYGEIGSVTPGKRADFVIADSDYNIKSVHLGKKMPEQCP